MPRPDEDRSRPLQQVVGTIRNGATRARNALADALPGERPRWLVLELNGSYPARRPRRRRFSPASLLPMERPTTLEELSEHVDAVLRAPWLEGVVLRFEELHVDLATAYALRNQLARLRAGGKRVVAWASELTGTGYYLASSVDEVVLPESATLQVNGMALTTLFMADALARLGVRFEKIAIREYKNAGDQLALPAMSEAQRRQYEALLDSMQQTYVVAVAESRGRDADEVRGWIDRGVTSATEARELGMIDRVAYEDEVLDAGHKPFEEGARFLALPVGPVASGRVAVVSLEGNIVTGASRRSPVPLPLFGNATAGSETLVRALRAAGRDARTRAVVFYVDSGGGSALASDLIWREVSVLAARKPVVAVMGRLAASGGYYVLTHATRVLAAPTTLTGSIGVLAGKFVLEEFYARNGFRPERIARGRFATMFGAASGWDDDERALVERYEREVYERFVERVADGRHLTPERVDEIGRGRVWTGADAVELGLVDELGDVDRAIVRARELAGLPADAPAWNVAAPKKLEMPPSADPSALLRGVETLLREPVWLMHPAALRID